MSFLELIGEAGGSMWRLYQCALITKERTDYFDNKPSVAFCASVLTKQYAYTLYYLIHAINGNTLCLTTLLFWESILSKYSPTVYMRVTWITLSVLSQTIFISFHKIYLKLVCRFLLFVIRLAINESSSMIVIKGHWPHHLLMTGILWN